MMTEKPLLNAVTAICREFAGIPETITGGTAAPFPVRSKDSAQSCQSTRRKTHIHEAASASMRSAVMPALMSCAPENT